MSTKQPHCTWMECKNPATRRADYRNELTWKKVIFRCDEHLGHHDFTDKLVDGKWVEIHTA